MQKKTMLNYTLFILALYPTPFPLVKKRKIMIFFGKIKQIKKKLPG